MHNKVYPLEWLQKVATFIHGLIGRLLKMPERKKESEQERVIKRIIPLIDRITFSFLTKEPLDHIHQVYENIASKASSICPGGVTGLNGPRQKLRPCRHGNAESCGLLLFLGARVLDVSLSHVCGLQLNCEIHMKSMEGP